MFTSGFKQQVDRDCFSVRFLHSTHHCQNIPAGVPLSLLIFSAQNLKSPDLSKPLPMFVSFFLNPRIITLFNSENFYLYLS